LHELEAGTTTRGGDDGDTVEAGSGNDGSTVETGVVVTEFAWPAAVIRATKPEAVTEESLLNTIVMLDCADVTGPGMLLPL